jgi:hypothetical protein
MNVYIQKQFANKRAYILSGGLSFCSYFFASYTFFVGAAPLLYRAFYSRNQYQLEQQENNGYPSQASEDLEREQRTAFIEITIFCLIMPVFSLMY